MPNALSTSQLTQYLARIDQASDQNKVKEAIKVYAELKDQGYQYASWAKGVAEGSSITGVAALDYMKGTAMMGLGGPECKNLTPAQVDKIRVDMAKGYLETLQSNALDNNSVNKDISFAEAEAFHKVVFDKNGLTGRWKNLRIELIHPR